MSSNPPDDLERDRKHREREILILVIATLVVVGGGVVMLFSGFETLLGALPCLLVGAGAIAALYLALVISERWTN